MRLAFFIVITAVLLSVNYFLGWSYDRLPEDITGRDSVRVMISHQYARLTPLKWLMLGENYRKEWSTPVVIPVLYIHRYQGGLTIVRLGGGEQTKSLHLVDSTGGKWVLRMVDKDVKSAVPEQMRNGIAINVVQDQVSAAYPYAPLTIYDLSKAAGVPSEHPELFFVPDDSSLGKYRGAFRNQVCFLEKDMPPSPATVRINTLEIKARLLATDSCRVVQEKVLKARLLDMLIADWDRHDRQWDWSWQDSGNIHYFYPIPEDRDQAYFYSSGLFTNLVRVIAMPQLFGFRRQSDHLQCLNHKVVLFDRFFLSQLVRSDWQRITREFVRQVDDRVIHTAMTRLPPEIYALRGKELEQKLRNRRDGLVKNVLEYYDFIARTVPVHTSREPEAIQIRQYTDRVELSIRRVKDQTEVYHRVLYPSETKEMILEGLGPEDSFNIEKKAASGIKLSFKGRDQKPFRITGNAEGKPPLLAAH